MDRSVGLRLALYFLFLLVTSLLVFRNPSSLVPQFASAIMLHIAVCVGVLMIFEVQHNHEAKNTRVIVVFSSVVLQLLSIPVLSIIISDLTFLITAIPYALAPIVTSVLLGKKDGLLATLGAALCGMLIVDKMYLMEYISMCMFSGGSWAPRWE